MTRHPWSNVAPSPTPRPSPLYDQRRQAFLSLIPNTCRADVANLFLRALRAAPDADDAAILAAVHAHPRPYHAGGWPQTALRAVMDAQPARTAAFLTWAREWAALTDAEREFFRALESDRHRRHARAEASAAPLASPLPPPPAPDPVIVHRPAARRGGQ